MNLDINLIKDPEYLQTGKKLPEEDPFTFYEVEPNYFKNPNYSQYFYYEKVGGLDNVSCVWSLDPEEEKFPIAYLMDEIRDRESMPVKDTIRYLEEACKPKN